ncbi:MAG: serine protease [Verrucomicrobia bacterium]|nr:serine protease [Verrucomicrobiota bacterium]
MKTAACLAGLSGLLGFLFSAGPVLGQAPGVPIVRDRGEQFATLVDKANELRETGELLSMEAVLKQLDRRRCELKLPEPFSQKLADREIWQRAHDAHVRVGWHYLCKKCDKWHQNLAGGYFITADGVVATCHHVVAPSDDLREGYLVAAQEDGTLLPVAEVLASDELSDTCIVRVKLTGPVKPLPLNRVVYPGDAAWCYSDPLGRSSYFSKGMVNRFFELRRRGKGTPRMDVSTDWAPGSSGAAVLDECGNAIGHVSEISTPGGRSRAGTNRTAAASSPMITFHYAARAADVIALVKPGTDQ